MSDYYEYYMNNPYERKVEERYWRDVDEARENEIEDAADEDFFVWDLLAEQYVDLNLTQTTLRAMFKSYCKLMHSTKPGDKENADKDLLIFTKSLMNAMYESAGEIIDGRNE
jgi:hypothetical protein